VCSSSSAIDFPLSHRGVADSRDLLGAEAAQHAAEDAGQPFVKKYSVQFVNSRGRESAPFYFWDNKPHECSQTWQVIRSEFDKMMLDNAREHGVDAQEGVRVLEVLFDGDRAVGVKIRDQQNNGSRRVCEGRGRRQRPDCDAAEPVQAADLGPGLNKGAI
jgi:flavin-dependent dehydrogenase